MTTIVTRLGKGAELTHPEMDANWNNLNKDKIEAAPSSTDNSVVRFDGVTGAVFQDSLVTITDSGDMGIDITTPIFNLHIEKTGEAVAFVSGDSAAFSLRDTQGTVDQRVIQNLLDSDSYQIRGLTDLFGLTVEFIRFKLDGSEIVVNENGTDLDFRVEGDTLPYQFFIDASAATENIALLSTVEPDWQTMDRGLFIGDRTTEPTGNPSSGFFMYSDGGAPKFRTSGGDVIILTGLLQVTDIDTLVKLNAIVTDDSIVGRETTDTLTNKTFDANGTGNTLSNVDVADLANGTDGELITWDAAGAPATVSVGAATQVLTSNGVGAAPTFQASGAGGGGLGIFDIRLLS